METKSEVDAPSNTPDTPTASVSLKIKYDMPGAEAETRIFVERIDPEFQSKHGRRDEFGSDEYGGIRFSRLKNGDSLTLNDLPAGKYRVARYRLVDIVREGTGKAQRSVYLDRQWIEPADQETNSISLSRLAGQPISGRVVIPADLKVNTLVVHVCSENARSSGSLNHRDVTHFDALNADAEGKFKTEPLPPGRYKIFIEAYADHSLAMSGDIAPSWGGMSEVTVTESVEPAALDMTLSQFDREAWLEDQTEAASSHSDLNVRSRSTGVLPDGQELEVVGVAYANIVTPSGTHRKTNEWWQADGTPFNNEPFKKLQPLSVAPEQKQFREFVIRLKARPIEQATHANPRMRKWNGDLWFGAQQEKHSAMAWDEKSNLLHQAVIGFAKEDPSDIAFYYTNAPTIDAGIIGTDGKVEASASASDPIREWLQDVKIASIEKSATETAVKLNRSYSQIASSQVFVNAIAVDGTIITPNTPKTTDRFVFKLPLSEIDVFQIKVRPMTHRVDCEDLALLPNQKSEPRVTLTPLDELATVTFRKDGKPLGILAEIRLKGLPGILKLLQSDLNSETDELVIETQRDETHEEVQRIVAKLNADGWKWPKITLKLPKKTEVKSGVAKPQADGLEFFKPYRNLQDEDVEKFVLEKLRTPFNPVDSDGSWQFGWFESQMYSSLSLVRQQDRVVKTLIKIVDRTESSTVDQRRMAMGYLGGHAPQKVLPLLIKELESATQVPTAKFVPYHEITVLGDIREEAREAIPLLIKLLESSDGIVCQESLMALVKIGPSSIEVMNAIANRFGSPDEDVWSRGVYEVGRYGELARPLGPTFVKLLKSKPREARIWAAQALVKSGYDEARGFETLIGEVAAGKSADRSLAASTLAALGSQAKSMIPELRKYENDSDIDVRKAVLDAILRIEKDDRILTHAEEAAKVAAGRGAVEEALANLRAASESPKKEKYLAKLPNGDEVELVSVAYAVAAQADGTKKRKEAEWWKADGTKLDATPPLNLFDSWVSADQADFREFAFRLKRADDTVPLTTHVDWTPKPNRGSGGATRSDAGLVNLQYVAGFKNEKPVAVHFFYSDLPTQGAGVIDLDGKMPPLPQADTGNALLQRIESFRKLIQIVGVEKNKDETILRFKLPAYHSELMEVIFVATDKNGNVHDADRWHNSPAENGRVFKLPAAEIGHFDIRLKLMTHKITFENVSLEPGQKSDVTVKVELILEGKFGKLPSETAEISEMEKIAGLEFLKLYPTLHGLSLDTTEPQFLEIVKQQELKTRKTIDGEKVTHHIGLGDGLTLLVMFDKDAKCSGIQRVRGEGEDKPAVVATLVHIDPPPVVGDFSKVEDPDVLLDELAKSQLPSLMPMTGGDFFQLPGAPPQAGYVSIWESQYARDEMLDPRIRRLIELGERAVPRVHQRLNDLAASDILATHLSIVLRSVGVKESVPVLIRLLKTIPNTSLDGTQSLTDEMKNYRASVTQLAVTSALWKLTGRKHVFTPDQWEQWWLSVKPDFVVLGDRQRPEFASRVTAERVSALVSELATNTAAARERSIALGPASLPHLMTLVAAELPKPPLNTATLDTANFSPQSKRLAWVIDELGATDQLPAKLRREYFTQRFTDAETYAALYPIDEDALCRALSHCSFADYCSIYLEADSQEITQQHLNHLKWPHNIYGAYCRRFNKLSPPNLGGWSDDPHWNKVVPAESPSREITDAVPVLLTAMKDERGEMRLAASKLAEAIGFCCSAKPETLIVALRDAWLTEADEKVRPEIAFAMCRFQTPFVVEEVAKGLLSNRPEIVSDCAGLIDWIPIQLNDETRASFERLVELTRHENDKLRNRAVRSLRSKAVKLLEPELLRLSQDKVVDIRKECAYALRDHADPKFADILFQLANDTDEQVRIEAFSSIANLNHPESMPRLVPLLRDKQVYGYAVSALASMGGKDALPLMMSELEDGNHVGGMVYQHLRRLTEENFEEKPEPWLAWWKQNKSAPKPNNDSAEISPSTVPDSKTIQAKELASFQGTWCWDFSQPWTWPRPIGVGTDSDGRKSERRWVIEGNRITWVGQDGQRVYADFSIDPFKTPKQIEFTFLNGPRRGQKSIGIYESKGDEDHRDLCMTDPGFDAPRPTDFSAGDSLKQSIIVIYRVTPPAKPSAANELKRLQGVWNMTLCDSTRRTFGGTQQEASKWQWTIKDDELLWSRQGEVWKLKLNINPPKSPREVDQTFLNAPFEMDLTFLDGPFQGAKCQGIFGWGGVDEQSLMIAIQDPGSTAPRPTKFHMSSDVGTGLWMLRPSKPSDVERELIVLQGSWTLRNFDTGNFKRDKDPSSWPLPGGKGPDKSGEGSELRWTIKGNDISWTDAAGQEIKASFTIDSNQRPKQIDLTVLSGPDKGKTCPGIYQRGDLDENILWLCIVDPDSKADRPKEFSYRWGEGRSVLSLYPRNQE